GYYAECDCFRLPRNRKLASLWAVRAVAIHDPSAQFPRAFDQQSSRVLIGTRRPVRTNEPSNAYKRDASRLVHHRRAWVVFTWLFSKQELDLIHRELLQELAKHGQRVLALHRDAVYVYLYAFTHR